MLKTVQHTVEFKNVSPQELFDIFMDSKKHSQIIGAKVEMSRKEGGKFSAFNGFVTGENLRIVPGRLIVQSWRGNIWNKEDLDSLLILFFEKTSQGAQIQLVHTGLPPQFDERWKELYWEPLKKILSDKKL